MNLKRSESQPSSPPGMKAAVFSLNSGESWMRTKRADMPPTVPHRHHRHGDGPGHGQDELDHVGDDHAPEAGQQGVAQSQGRPDDDRRPLVHAQDRLGHGAQPLEHPAQHDEVVDDGEVAGLEAAQEGRRLAAVAHFDELVVGDDLGPPPESREQEHRQHLAQHVVPAEPVVPDAVVADEARHRQRRIGGEGGGHHARAQDPPGAASVRTGSTARWTGMPCGETPAPARRSRRRRRR